MLTDGAAVLLGTRGWREEDAQAAPPKEMPWSNGGRDRPRVAQFNHAKP